MKAIQILVCLSHARSYPRGIAQRAQLHIRASGGSHGNFQALEGLGASGHLPWGAKSISHTHIWP